MPKQEKSVLFEIKYTKHGFAAVTSFECKIEQVAPVFWHRIMPCRLSVLRSQSSFRAFVIWSELLV